MSEEGTEVDSEVSPEGDEDPEGNESGGGASDEENEEETAGDEEGTAGEEETAGDDEEEDIIEVRKLLCLSRVAQHPISLLGNHCLYPIERCTIDGLLW